MTRNPKKQPILGRMPIASEAVACLSVRGKRGKTAMLVANAAATAVSAIFVSGPIATLPTITIPTIVVGAMAVGHAPAMAQVGAFGVPMKLSEATAPKTESAPAPSTTAATTVTAEAPAFAAPVPAATAAPAPLPVAAPIVAQSAPVMASGSTWRVEVADMNIRRVIERWSRTAGMQVIYESTKDIDVGATAAFSGTYEHALQQLLAAIESSEMPLRACLYANAVARVIPRMSRCD